LNSAFAATLRVVIPAAVIITNKTYTAVAKRSGTAGKVVALALVGPTFIAANCAFAYCVASPAWQLLFDPHGRVWMDRVANTQIVDL
jgi:hypothetical protein